MKKKSARIKNKKRTWHKLAPLAFLASALVAGVVFIQTGSLNQTIKKTPPKIDSISPTTGHLGQEITFTGSGFTTQEEYQGSKGRRAGGQIASFPGNFFQVKGRVFGPPTLSPDGKTLKFPELGLSTREVSDECQPGTTGRVCRIRLQVVNGFGQVSNPVNYQVFISDKPLNFFSSAYALDSPTNLNVAAGALDVEVLRIKVRADAQNQDDIYVGDLLIQTSPPSLYIDCTNTFGHFKAVNAETGALIGMGGMGPSFGGNLGCWTFFNLSPVITLPPGTEKTLVVKMNLQPQAPVGLQFSLGATPGPGGPYIGWVDYPGPQGSGNSITIVTP